LAGEVVIAGVVARFMCVLPMLATINFDDESMAQAHEVDNETIARRLLAKMKASRSP